MTSQMENTIAPSPERLTQEPEHSPASAFASYLRGIMRHRWLFAAVVFAAVFGAAAWIAQRAPTYEAKAEILVTPIPASDTSFVGLPLIRAADLEPERATGTAATLLSSKQVAMEAAESVGGGDPSAAAAGMSIEARPDSSLVDVISTAGSADRAEALANAYARAAIAAEDEALAPRVDRAIVQAERQLADIPLSQSDAITELQVRLADLRSIARSGDPTLSLARLASPGAPENLPAPQILFLALIAGLILAAVTSVLVELLAIRPIATEAELRPVYPLPILARVPGSSRRDDLRRPLVEAAPGLREGYRVLREQLELRSESRRSEGRNGGKTVLLVSPGRAEGSSACALNLARAIVSGRQSATVVELNLRRPQMAEMLGIDPVRNVTALIDGTPAETAVERPAGSDGFQLLAAPPFANASLLEDVTAQSTEIVDRVRRIGDWVVVDVAPISEAADALVVAHAVDHVLVVVRLGTTDVEELARARELFKQVGIVPDGYVVVSEEARRRPWSSKSIE
jgi:Mrp family chromosome partitioning ATPase/capsular polysaccharide biosynthesis protein